MTWRDKLFKASFRDVPFEVSASSVKSGRRIVQEERFQARTITRDMGPVLPIFDVEAYIIQDAVDHDYFDRRNNLISALDKSSANEKDIGTLIHPFFGSKKVHVGEYTVEETFAEGGIAKFRIQFQLEEAEIFPGKTKDFKGKVDTQAVISNARCSDNFFDKFDSGVSFIESQGRDAIYALQRIQTSIIRVNNAVKSTIATAQGIVSTAISQINAALSSPCDLYDTILDATDAWKVIVGMAGVVVKSGIIGGCSGEERTTGVTLDGETIPEKLGVSIVEQMIYAQDFDETNLGSIADVQEDNRKMLVNIIKAQELILASQMAIRIEYTSQEKMFYILNLLAEAIEEFLLRLGGQTTIDTNDIFIALEDLRSLLFSLLLEKVSELKRTITYEVPNGITSVLTVAYDLYEDTNRVDEIIDRNYPVIRHPGFLPGGDTISVLEA